MANKTSLSVAERKRSGKGAARELRRKGHIPAVVYGDKKTPILISIEEKLITKEMHTPGFGTRLFEIAAEGDKLLALCQVVQTDPVSDRPIHADFLRVGKDSEMYIHVPVTVKNELLSPGLKMGGVLNIVERTVEIVCKPDNIPENFEIDLTGFEMGHVVHSGDLKMPAGARLAEDESFTVLTIVAPTKVEETPQQQAADAAAAAAPAAGKDAAKAPADKAAAPAAKK